MMIDRNWMKELGIEITRSNRAYERYQIAESDFEFTRMVNRTFALGFSQEELVDKNVNLSLLSEKIVFEIEKRLVLDAFHSEERTLFAWEKLEGQPIRYFTLEQVEKLLFIDPVSCLDIEGNLNRSRFEDSKLIFQERWPWELTQNFDISDTYKLRARLAAQIVHKEAKLVEED